MSLSERDLYEYRETQDEVNERLREKRAALKRAGLCFQCQHPIHACKCPNLAGQGGRRPAE